MPKGPSIVRSRSSRAPKNHLALLNRLAIKIDIKVGIPSSIIILHNVALMLADAIEVGADQDGAIFSEVELKTMLLTIEIKETRHVIVIGKLTHMQVYDVIPANVDGSIFIVRQ